MNCDFALQVDGQDIADPTEDYVLRVDNWSAPVLYFQGRRVTKTWQVSLRAHSEEDTLGQSANTT